MSKYEDLAFKVGKTTQLPGGLKGQIARLKADLEQFVLRKPDGPVVESLRARIRALEAEMAGVEAGKKRDRQAGADAKDDADSDSDRPRGRTSQTTSTRFPPRQR